MAIRPTLHADNRWLSREEWEPLTRSLGVPPERLHVRQVGGQPRVRVMQPWLELPLGEAWVGFVRLAGQGGQPVVAEVRVFPAESRRRRAGVWSAELLGSTAAVPRGGLSQQTLRSLRFRDIWRFTKAILGQLEKQHGSAATREFGLPGDRPRRARAGGRPDIFYATLADAYGRELARGNRHPTAELARRRGVRPSQMRDAIREARERGLLTFFSHGRPGGELTVRARDMLGKSFGPNRSRRRR